MHVLRSSFAEYGFNQPRSRLLYNDDTALSPADRAEIQLLALLARKIVAVHYSERIQTLGVEFYCLTLRFYILRKLGRYDIDLFLCDGLRLLNIHLQIPDRAYHCICTTPTLDLDQFFSRFDSLVSVHF